MPKNPFIPDEPVMEFDEELYNQNLKDHEYPEFDKREGKGDDVAKNSQFTNSKE